MGVSKNRGGPPKPSILIGFSIINHPFLGTIIFGNTHIYIYLIHVCFHIMPPGMPSMPGMPGMGPMPSMGTMGTMPGMQMTGREGL